MIPNYTLYGDEKNVTFPDILHCESIAARSGRHNWKIAPHRHHILHQFFYISKGGGTFLIDGKRRKIDSDSFLSVPPFSVHGFEFIKHTEGYVVTVPSVVLAEVLRRSPDIQAGLSEALSLPETKRLKVYFEHISDEHGDTLLGRSQRLANLVGLLCIETGRLQASLQISSPQKVTKQQKIVQSFLRQLEQNFRTIHSVATYADLLFLTTQHLTRSCKSITGKTASALITDRLMLEAKRSLVYTKLPVSELAYTLGFEDPGHFTKFFQRHTGLSPSKFRKKSEQNGR
ncbi:helix-turn-helix domain-containing protein [Sneathiella sp.]|jgi:AraC family transcriptional activator of pobA|uniref:helix-turn-helix domain-containing protein n=1 Tax=Sneathiella sp. TaxID=1964365 RepID=UPI0039E251CB